MLSVSVIHVLLHGTPMYVFFIVYGMTSDILVTKYWNNMLFNPLLMANMAMESDVSYTSQALGQPDVKRFNSVWPCDVIWRHRSESTLARGLRQQAFRFRLRRRLFDRFTWNRFAYITRTTRMPVFWGYSPPPHNFSYYWAVHFESQAHTFDQFISDPK